MRLLRMASFLILFLCLTSLPVLMGAVNNTTQQLAPSLNTIWWTAEMESFVTKADAMKAFADDYLNQTIASLRSVRALVDEAEEAGYYVAYERMRLATAENLVESSQSWLMEDYDKAYADLHEAHLIIVNVEECVLGMFESASWSVFFISPLLGFTSVAVTFILVDDQRWRLTFTLTLYGALFGLLHLLYPGYTTLQKTAYNPWANTPFEPLVTPLLMATSILIPLLLVYGLPRALKEKTFTGGLRPMSAVATAFSVAGRNLRRRRLRTLLTSIFTLTSMFAFIALTSLSFEYGFFILSRPGQATSEGFLLRNPGPIETTPFISIAPEILRWLRARPEASLVIPKIENIPQAQPVGVLIAASRSGFDVYGVLGVYPSLEARVTKMNGVVESGRFLGDDDLNGILISEEAANSLQVEVNDTIMFRERNFTVSGIFDSRKLEDTRDLDRYPIVPQLLIVEGLVTVDYCGGRDVVIMHAETAKRLPRMVVSRVDVKTRNPEEIVDLARLTVLRWTGFEAFAFAAGEIYYVFVGPYHMASGFASFVVPLALVVVNVGVMMLSAVHERKREVAIMSTVGLNPFHISAIFVAEALVVSIVAGSLGYFLGLASYRFLIVSTPFGVRQKVEVFWGILVLCLSMAAAVLGSALPAVKASAITTPSLVRKFVIRWEEKPRTSREPWLLKIPILVREEELTEFFSFMKKRLQRASYPHRKIEDLKGEATRLSFTYVNSEEGFVTENELFPVETRLPTRYTFKLASKTRRGSISAQDEIDVRRTASLVRHFILLYTTRKT